MKMVWVSKLSTELKVSLATLNMTHLFPFGQMRMLSSELVIMHSLDFFLRCVDVGPC